MKAKSGKTSVDLDENVEGLLCYLLGFVTGIIFIIIEKKSRFVKFHAWQSTAIFLLIALAHFFISWLPLMNRVLTFALGVVTFVVWILMMYKAYHNEMYKLPIVGDFAEKQSAK